MNRINNLFSRKNKNILSVYFTAGHPGLNDTADIILELDRSGVDLIEVGIPFSDPIADGPVIQGSSEKALVNGMTLNLLFRQLADIRKSTEIPLILMGYFNPVFRFGIENFLTLCSKTGIDGTIIPDLPVDEYKDNYEILFARYNILNIFLITPQSPDERVKYIDDISKGFLYVVSASATTGGSGRFGQTHLDYFKKLKDLDLRSPRLTGFGISDRTTFNQACEYSNGAIIGSAFIRSLDDEGSLPEKINKFVREFRE